MGSQFSAQDQKAIQWFFEQNPRFKPTITYYPVVSYWDGKDYKEKHIAVVRQAYRRGKK